MDKECCVDKDLVYRINLYTFSGVALHVLSWEALT